MNNKKVYCRYCGKLIDEDAPFCTYCGKPQGDVKQGFIGIKIKSLKSATIIQYTIKGRFMSR